MQCHPFWRIAFTKELTEKNQHVILVLESINI